jgi:hypothetical protein
MLETPITWNTYSDGILVPTGTNSWRTAHKTKGVGAWPVYHRHVSNEVFEPPFTFYGRLKVRDRLENVIIESENRVPTWDWGLCFFPIHVDNDNNLVTRFWNKSQKITLHQEIEHKYTSVGDPINYSNPAFDTWYSFIFEVNSYTNYAFKFGGRNFIYWDFPNVSNTLLKPINVGFRCDFFDVEFKDIAVRQERKTNMYQPINPKRVMDLRPNRPSSGAILTVKTGAPKGASVAHVNITVVDSVGPGFVSAWAQGKMPETSILNTFTKGQTVANAVNVPLDSLGDFRLYTSGGDFMLVDVMGFYS